MDNVLDTSLVKSQNQKSYPRLNADDIRELVFDAPYINYQKITELKKQIAAKQFKICAEKIAEGLGAVDNWYHGKKSS